MYSLLGPDILISHATQTTSEELILVASAGAHISATPLTELQMALAEPVCFRSEISQYASLGVDCHSAASASIVGQARIALQHVRGQRNQECLDAGEDPVALDIQVQDAFNLMTIKGARASRLEDHVGSIAEGKRADLIVWDTDSPGMVVAAQHDPVAAIVLHSSIRDVNTVIINGAPKKRNGKLLPLVMPGEEEPTTWASIANMLLQSYARIQEAAVSIDFEKARREARQTWPYENSG